MRLRFLCRKIQKFNHNSRFGSAKLDFLRFRLPCLKNQTCDHISFIAFQFQKSVLSLCFSYLPPLVIAGIGDMQNVSIVESQPSAGQPVVLNFAKNVSRKFFLNKRQKPCEDRSRKELVHKAFALDSYAPRCLRISIIFVSIGLKLIQCFINL